VDAPLSATGGSTVTGFVGQPFTASLATFVDTGGLDLPDPSDYLAAIDWGDGTPSDGTISGPDSKGVFTVAGSHTYAYQGTGRFTISVTIMTITENAAAPVTVTDTADIPDFALYATGLDIRARQNTSQDQTVAQFIDTDPNGTTADFTATIDWGDGARPNTATVTQPGGPGTPFLVDFTHTYSNAGTFTVQVMISDVDGAVAATSSTPTVTSPAARAIPPGGRNNLGMPFPLSAFGMVLGEEQLLSANGKAQKADPQPMNTATTPGPNGPGTPFPAQVSNPLESRRQVRGSDTYWRDLYWQQREQASDPNGWAAHELALALIETTS
jgi:hypothetical protein